MERRQQAASGFSETAGWLPQVAELQKSSLCILGLWESPHRTRTRRRWQPAQKRREGEENEGGISSNAKNDVSNLHVYWTVNLHCGFETFLPLEKENRGLNLWPVSAAGSQHIWETCWCFFSLLLSKDKAQSCTCGHVCSVRRANCCAHGLRLVSSPQHGPHWAFMSPQTHLAQSTGVPQSIATKLPLSDKGRPNSQYPECSLIWSGPVWQ